ncbi:MAG: FAD-dependent oxidoreductase [Blastochloris sp.]|nr:FAD-dependent oxidoreductase [Blastochloris sp.]
MEAGGEVYRCEKLIITAGAWTNNALAHFGMKLPLTVTKEQVSYFTGDNPADFAPGRFPIWIWQALPRMYGLPAFGVDGMGMKIGADAIGKPVTPETRTFEVDAEAYQQTIDWMAKYTPSALGDLLYTKTCLYTLTPDREFIIDTLPDYPNCAVGVGAGHAFKFASVFGRVLGELVTTGETSTAISHFTIDRPILLEENPMLDVTGA